MSAKIGVLGETTATGTGTTTVYTVPASKAAKVRLIWYINAPNTSVVSILVNGITVWKDTAAADEYTATMAPSGSTTAIQATAFSTTDPLANGANVIAPLPVDYYLATGDTVQLTIATVDATTVFLQVVGVEDDA